jgi:hypothetical protein
MRGVKGSKIKPINLETFTDKVLEIIKEGQKRRLIRKDVIYTSSDS